MSELTDRIEKLKKLREAATKGKWHRTGSNYVTAPSCIVHQIEYNPAHTEETVERHKADALFIAAAANDAIPILEAAQAEIERLERQLEKEYERGYDDGLVRLPRRASQSQKGSK